jgi:HSP20 family protein
MAPNRSDQQREENPRQGTSTTLGKTSERSETGTERSDRQRSIDTAREEGRSTGVAGRPMTSPVYGRSTQTSPFMLMRRMADDMDRLFENFGFGRLGLAPSFGTGLNRDLWTGSSALDQPIWSPEVDTFRRGDNLVVRADLPGLNKDDVKVEIDNGVLTISGERRDEREERRDDFYVSERSYGQFYRAIPLPEGLTSDQVDATFKDGVLEVTLPVPKQPERKAKQIQIR